MQTPQDPSTTSPDTFPIRVGGLYPSRIHPQGDIAFRVIAITGDRVYFAHHSKRLGEFGLNEFGLSHFRASVTPEDRSPIPELIAALEDVEEYLDERADADHNGMRFVPDAAMRLLATVRAAIAKVEGRP